MKYDDFFGGKAAEGVNVKLTNLQNGQIYTVKTDAQGKASVVISAGTYDISASISLSAEQMKRLFGEEKEASFNASLSKVTILPLESLNNAEEQQPTHMELIK